MLPSQIDWTRLAQEWDGVHLSWFGYLTAEAVRTPVGAGRVAHSRYWDGEQTVWLRDVVTAAHPLPVPARPDGTPCPNVTRPRRRSLALPP